MNTSKTKLVWIGRKRHSKDKFDTRYQLDWGQKEFSFLGIEFSTDINKMPDLNFPNALRKIDNIFVRWKRRSLIPLCTRENQPYTNLSEWQIENDKFK